MTIAEFCTANNKPRSTVRARWNAAKAKNPTLPAFDITREVDAQTRAIIDPTSRAKPAQKPASSRAKSSPNDAQHLRAEVQVFAHDFTRKVEVESAQFSHEHRVKIGREIEQDLRGNGAGVEGQTVALFRPNNDPQSAQEPRKSDAQNEPNPAQEPTPEPAQTRATFDGHFLRTDGFLFVTLCAAMIGQMAHTSWVFYRNIPEEQPLELRVILAIVCAIGVDCTALVMTVKRGGIRYLITFALIHFAVNLTAHFQDSEEVGWGSCLVFILLSGVLAFSNFSYTDLFSRK